MMPEERCAYGCGSQATWFMLQLLQDVASRMSSQWRGKGTGTCCRLFVLAGSWPYFFSDLVIQAVGSSKVCYFVQTYAYLLLWAYRCNLRDSLVLREDRRAQIQKKNCFAYACCNGSDNHGWMAFINWDAVWRNLNVPCLIARLVAPIHGITALVLLYDLEIRGEDRTCGLQVSFDISFLVFEMGASKPAFYFLTNTHRSPYVPPESFFF